MSSTPATIVTADETAQTLIQDLEAVQASVLPKPRRQNPEQGSIENIFARVEFLTLTNVFYIRAATPSGHPYDLHSSRPDDSKASDLVELERADGATQRIRICDESDLSGLLRRARRHDQH